MLLLHIICVQNQQSTDYQPVLRNRLFVMECKIKRRTLPSITPVTVVPKFHELNRCCSMVSGLLQRAQRTLQNYNYFFTHQNLFSVYSLSDIYMQHLSLAYFTNLC